MTTQTDQIADLTADVATTRQKLNKNADELVRVEALGEPARNACQAAEALRQQRADILSMLIVSGSGKLTSSELDKVEAAIEASRPDERRAEDLLAAQAGVLGSLRQERAELERNLSVQTRAVLLAKHHAARNEIEKEALPAVLAAAEVLRMAYGRLVGLRSAHSINAKLIQERCGGTKPFSESEFQPYSFNVEMHGVVFPHPHQFGRFSVASECRAASCEALYRWGSIGEEVPTGYESHIWPPLN